MGYHLQRYPKSLVHNAIFIAESCCHILFSRNLIQWSAICETSDMVLYDWVEPLTKFQNDMGSFEVAYMVNHFTEYIDILIDCPCALEVLWSL
jgi:hypothetical protein